MNSGTQTLFINRKYLWACVMAFLFGGRVTAQEIKTDTINPEPPVSLTHRNPFRLAEPQRPKNPTVKFSAVADVFSITIKSDVNVTSGGMRPVFAPVIKIQPFVRFLDKITVGVTTTQMVQNYTGPTFKMAVFDMYAITALRTSVGTFDVKFGKVSPLNYPKDFEQTMPVSHFMLNETSLNPHHYFPRAALLTFTGHITTVSVGYAEMSPGFKFTGNGYVVLGTEQAFDESIKIGGVVAIGKNHTFGNGYLVYKPLHNIAMLLEISNLGERAAMFADCRYDFPGDVVSVALTAFVQSDDGVRGGAIGVYHTPSGAYVSIGGAYHDPMYEYNVDGTACEAYNKFNPSLEVGITHNIYPRKVR